ncbi:hypothetical protein [Nannocystis bainbridge]|uniref:Uncharacterized protein n=1 Tax=Nannocystis bainbridge TaxID=2995303 RepID=A0ABT5DQF6_9BACT|nr:hypothetical protein [Nannocystis bainbridge]MDC0715885.1 hypothetical protein [Nannocystis bainbridge]
MARSHLANHASAARVFLVGDERGAAVGIAVEVAIEWGPVPGHEVDAAARVGAAEHRQLTGQYLRLAPHAGLDVPYEHGGARHRIDHEVEAAVAVEVADV